MAPASGGDAGTRRAGAPSRRGRRRRGPVRVDQPLAHRRSLRVSVDPETVGKLSERIARFLGSWRFIGYMSAFVASWVLWNVFGPADLRFDAWPFIGLTLLLSLQASYAAPLILLAANRQADRDRVQYNEDRSKDERIVADVDFLAREVAALRIAVGEVATRDYLRHELRELTETLSSAQFTESQLNESARPRGKGKLKGKEPLQTEFAPAPRPGVDPPS